MKTTPAQFKRFCDRFKYWQEKFGCLDIQVYFELRDIDDREGEISIDMEGHVATVRLNSTHDSNGFSIDKIAVHEALHLLLQRISYIGACRWADGSELQSAEEGVVRVLERLL